MGCWVGCVCFGLLGVYIGFVISSFCLEFGFGVCWVDCLICWLVVGFVVCYFVLRCYPDG